LSGPYHYKVSWLKAASDLLKNYLK
jgi:hypothetical protein